MAKKAARKTQTAVRRRRSAPTKAFVDGWVHEIIDEVIEPKRGGLVTIAVPAVDQQGKPLDRRQELWLGHTLEKLADLFRGASAIKLDEGIYKHDNGDYQFEKSIFVQSFADARKLKQESVITDLVVFCARMRSELNQESVLLAINSSAFFIEESR